MLLNKILSKQARKPQITEGLEHSVSLLPNPHQRHLLNYSFPRLKGTFFPLSALKSICIVLLLLFAGWQLYGAVYIKVKAQIAQVLLERAWQNSSSIETKKPWPWADTYPVAKLSVAEQNIQQIVLAGATGRTLAFGPGMLMASYDFQEEGATAIAGHRDTHFSFLQHIELDSIIDIENASGEQLQYRVIETQITDINESHLRLEDSRSLLVLITCYPFNTIAPTGDLRYIITAELI